MARSGSWPDRRPVPLLESDWPYRIVRASRNLPDSCAKLFGLMLELDRPSRRNPAGGCFMGIVELANQVGKSPDHTDELRRHLAKVGLLHREVVKGRHESFWFPTLPPGIESAPDSEIESTRSVDDRTQKRRGWLRRMADLLDHHIEDVEARSTTPLAGRRERAEALRQRGERSPQRFQDGRERSRATGGNVPAASARTTGNSTPHRGEPSPLSEIETAADRPRSESLSSSKKSESELLTPPHDESVSDRTRSGEDKTPAQAAQPVSDRPDGEPVLTGSEKEMQEKNLAVLLRDQIRNRAARGDDA